MKVNTLSISDGFISESSESEEFKTKAAILSKLAFANSD